MLAPVTPTVKHGLLKAYGSLLREDPVWRALKDQMAQASLSAKWSAFLRNENLVTAAAQALQPFVDGQQGNPQLARKAADYARHKQRQAQTVVHRHEGRVGAKFLAKRTNLHDDIRRTREGTVYMELPAVTPEHREMIARQTGLQMAIASPELGRGVHGRVALAQTLSHDGTPDGIVAVKTNLDKAEEISRMQAQKMRTLPPSPQLMRMRESYVGHKVVQQLSELAMGGTANALLRRLRHSDLPDERKQRVTASVLYKVLDGLAVLHEASRAHGDVKLGNVLIAPEAGAVTRVILHDVGPGNRARKDRKNLAREIQGLAQTFAVGMPTAVCNQLVEALNDRNRALWTIMEHPYFGNRLTDEELTAELAHVLPSR